MAVSNLTLGTELTYTKAFLFSFFFKDFIYLFLERGAGGRKRGRGTSMCERYINWLPLTCPQLGT